MITGMGNNSIVTITGLSKPADTTENQKSWTTEVKYSDLGCYIEQLDPKTSMLFSGEGGVKMFQLLTNTVLEIIEGDKITDNHSREFVVQGVQSFIGDADVPDHTEVILVSRYPNN